MAKTEGQKMVIDAVLVAKAAQNLVDAFSDVSPVDPEVFLDALYNRNINFDFAHEVARAANIQLFRVDTFEKQDGTAYTVSTIRCAANVSLKEAYAWSVAQGFEMVSDELTVRVIARLNGYLGGKKVYFYRKDCQGGYSSLRFHFDKTSSVNDSVILEAAHDCLFVQKKNERTG